MAEGLEKTILLASGDHLLGESYRTGLAAAGYSIRDAFDGDEALEHARSDRADLIILDSVLQKKDGFSVLEDLRGESAFDAIPIIMMSDLGSAAERDRAASLGAADLIVKSRHNAVDVVDMVRGALGGEQAHKPLQQSSAPHDLASVQNTPNAQNDSADALLGEAEAPVSAPAPVTSAPAPTPVAVPEAPADGDALLGDEDAEPSEAKSDSNV